MGYGSGFDQGPLHTCKCARLLNRSLVNLNGLNTTPNADIIAQRGST